MPIPAPRGDGGGGDRAGPDDSGAGRRVDLSDVTVVIPFRHDPPERLRNLRIVTGFLARHLDTTVLVAEYDAESRLDPATFGAAGARVRHVFFANPLPYFHKARCLNLAVATVDTPLVALHDADVLVMPERYAEAAAWVRDGRCALCLPYENRVMWVPRDAVPSLGPDLDPATLAALDFERSDDRYAFLGLINLFDISAFRAAGMMNENFRSWGYEDVELYVRLLKLGFPVRRTRGLAWHLGHGTGGDSGPNHGHFLDNQREYHKVLALDPEDLRSYVASWSWVSPDRSGSTPAPSG